MVVAGLAAENGLRSCNWSATAAGWCRTQCGHTSSAAERRPSDVTPRCFRELDSIMFYSEGRHSPVPGNCVPARPAPSPRCCRVRVSRDWARVLAPSSGAAPAAFSGHPAPHPRPAAPLLYCQGLSSRLTIPVTSSRAGLGLGLDVEKNKEQNVPLLCRCSLY